MIQTAAKSRALLASARRTVSVRAFKWRSLTFLAVLSMVAPAAYGYIDPGAGSTLVYIISGVVISLYFTIRSLAYRVWEAFLRAGQGKHTCEIAIHSEHPRYEITFMPVLRELANRDCEVTYFTMYERDHPLEALPPGIRHQQIAAGLVGYAQLNTLEARILVTTTPQLDVMTFRRTPRVEHYCHIPHVLGESIYVRPYGYDFFDSVCCCGPVLKKNIRRIEFIRKLPTKELYECGIPHYDELLRSQHSITASHRSDATILIAPSWGPLSIFEAFGTELVNEVAQRFEVIVRPHPQMQFSQPELYQKVISLSGVDIDTSTTPESAMASSDLLVSDISGIMHEFAFIHEKPVIFVDHQTGVEGMDGQLFGGESDFKTLCRDFIVPIHPNDLAQLPERIAELLETDSSAEIPATRDRLVYHFGSAGKSTARQIFEILQCLPT